MALKGVAALVGVNVVVHTKQWGNSETGGRGTQAHWKQAAAVQGGCC